MNSHDDNRRTLFSFIEPSSKSFAKAAITCIIAECLDQLHILRDLIGQCDLVFSENVIEYKSLHSR